MSLSEKIYSFRMWANENPKIVIPIVAVVVIVAIYWGYTVMRGPQPVDLEDVQVYYYDLETEEVFTAGADRTPPFERDNGHMAVRAAMYRDRDDPDAEPFVGYLERLSPEARENPRARRELPGEGLEVSTDGEEWYPKVGRFYGELIEELQSRGATRVRPGD